MISTRKADAAAAAIKAVSKHDIIRTLVENPTGKQNMVKVDGSYKAEAAGDAKARGFLKESGRGKGDHVGAEMIGKTLGLAFNPLGNKPTGFIGYKDVSSKNSKGAYDFRTMTIFDTLNPDRNLPFVWVCDNYGKWIKVHLDDVPDWPPLPAKAVGNFLQFHGECLTVGTLIGIFGKKIEYLKKAVRKDGDKATAADGSTYAYIPPTGNIERIVKAADGESIGSEGREIHRVRLSVQMPAPKLEVLYPDWSEFIPEAFVKSGKNKGNLKAGTGVVALKADPALLPLYVAERDRLKAEYETTYAIVRPFEMGIVERAKDSEGGSFPETVDVGGTIMELEVNTDTEYDQPLDTAEKLAAGEYVKKAMPSTRGAWVLRPAPKTAKETQIA